MCTSNSLKGFSHLFPRHVLLFYFFIDIPSISFPEQSANFNISNLYTYVPHCFNSPQQSLYHTILVNSTTQNVEVSREILGRWTRFFLTRPNAGSERLDPDISAGIRQKPTATALGSKPTTKNVTAALRSMDNSKAVELDEFPEEPLKLESHHHPTVIREFHHRPTATSLTYRSHTSSLTTPFFGWYSLASE